jgi:hypothetical protein
MPALRFSGGRETFGAVMYSAGSKTIALAQGTPDPAL